MKYIPCIKCGHEDWRFDDFIVASTYICQSCKRKADASEGKDIDTDNMSCIICPYCGHEMDECDSCELASRNECGTDTCDECGRDYEWYAEVSVEFSTHKIDAKEASHDNS